MNIKYFIIAGWALSVTNCTQEKDTNIFGEPLNLKEGALSRSERDAKDHFKSGVYLSETEDSKGAIEEFTKAIVLNPNDAEYWYARGKERSVMGDEDGAINDYTKAIELDSENSMYYYKRGELLFSPLYNWSLAIDDYSKAIELEPSNDDYFRARAQAKAEYGDREGALDDFSIAIALNPSNHINWAARWQFHLNFSKNYSKGIADISKAIELDPSNGFYLDCRAQTRYLNGDKEGACADARMAKIYEGDLGSVSVSEFCD